MGHDFSALQVIETSEVTRMVRASPTPTPKPETAFIRQQETSLPKKIGELVHGHGCEGRSFKAVYICLENFNENEQI